MVLEAVMILLDNSEFCRNGDYSPSRLDAQTETANAIAGAKTQSNPETTVGLASMAGARVDVHVTPTRNLGQLMSVMGKEVHVGGRSNFVAALKTAQLVLKNRQNKNQRQRIVMFVGSPIDCKLDELVKLGKVFKKNNLAVDLINFGAENSANENPEKLEAFRAAVDNQNNSHFLPVPPGPHILSDLVLTSAIMMGDSGSSAAAAAPGAAGKPGAPAASSHLGGVDPNVDPELAMVLKMSYEEDRIKHGGGAAAKPAEGKTNTAAAAAKPAAGSATAPVAATPAKAGGATATATPAAKPATTTAPAAPTKAGGAAAPAAAEGAAPMEEDDQAELAKALAMSLVDEPAASSSSTGAQAAASKPAGAAGGAGGAGGAAPAAGADAAMADDLAEALKNPDFLNSIVGDLPGIDKSTLQLDDILNQLTGDGAGSAAGSATAGKKAGDDKKKPDDKKKDGNAGAGAGSATGK